MGMCASILAIGPFAESIASLLEYSADRYSNTRPGVPVISYLFGIIEGSSASRAFAAALGISDAWDFNQHKIDLDRVAFDELQRVLDGFHEHERYQKDLSRFRRLAASGFEFYFMPNG